MTPPIVTEPSAASLVTFTLSFLLVRLPVVMSPEVVFVRFTSPTLLETVVPESCVIPVDAVRLTSLLADIFPEIFIPFSLVASKDTRFVPWARFKSFSPCPFI